jgi:PAS domain S-box-containing protein
MAADEKPLTLGQALALTEDARVITTADSPMRIIHTNRAWSNLTGYKFAEVAGATCKVLQGPATQRKTIEMLGKAIEKSQRVKAKIVNYTRDGQPFINEIDCRPVEGGTHFYATIKGEPIVDGSVAVWEERATEAAATPPPEAGEPVNYASQQPGRPKRQSEKLRISNALANTVDPMVFCAADYPHQITHPNQAWCEMCGYTLEDVEGLTNSILTGPETDPVAIANLLACVRRLEPTVQTLVNYKKGGKRFVNQVQVMPVYNDDDDDVAAFISLLREIDDGNM